MRYALLSPCLPAITVVMRQWLRQLVWITSTIVALEWQDLLAKSLRTGCVWRYPESGRTLEQYRRRLTG